MALILLCFGNSVLTYILLSKTTVYYSEKCYVFQSILPSSRMSVSNLNYVHSCLIHVALLNITNCFFDSEIYININRSLFANN